MFRTQEVEYIMIELSFLGVL